MKGKEEIINQLEKELKEVTDPMVKRAIQEKIKTLKEDKWILK